jgi:RNA polymerase sigma-70 factor (ECF subfamily)
MNAEAECNRGWTLEALQQREPGAVEGWFREQADLLYRFILYRVGKDRELTTDLVQETFLTALRKIGDYDPDRGAMFVWLTTLARNEIRRALRQRKRTQTYAEFWEKADRLLAQAYAELATAPLADEVLERAETAELVQLTLSSIPGNYSRVLTEHYRDAQPIKAIARRQGLTEGAVKSMLHRAREAFRQAFETYARRPSGQLPPRRAVP